MSIGRGGTYLPLIMKNIFRLSKIKRKKLFGTAGIRGLTNLEITPLLALKISQVFGDYLGNQGSVALGYDTRYGAQMLAHSATSGLMSAGLDVIDCGCIPTGGLSSFITQSGLKGGVMLTGSHMPYNLIGIILIMSDGSYLSEEIARELEDRYYNYDSRRVTLPLKNIGSYQPAEKPLELYKKFLMSKINPDLIRIKKYKVLIDPGNGTAIFVLPQLLQSLGCPVVFINEEPKPQPDRPTEPRANNLSPAVTRLKEHHCDLGIATDIDADRVLFIDHNGNVLSEDLTGAIFARDIIQKNKNNSLIVTPINSSGLIEHTCQKFNARLEYCGVGQPATLQVVKQLKANFSYEESGKYYFSEEVFWADGILAGLKLLELLSRENKTLAELAGEFPRFYQVKHTLPCENKLKNKIMSEVKTIWEKEALTGKVKDITIDGLKRIYEDKAWLLIRQSGTEPLIRVYSDALSPSRAEELVQSGEKMVKHSMDIIQMRSLDTK